MKQKRPGRIPGPVLIALLAVVCIGAAELAVCRVADPALFGRLAAPVRTTWRAAIDAVASEYRAIQHKKAERAEARRLAELALREAESEASQQASEPVVETSYPPADPAITELVVSEGQEILLGGNTALTYFNQGDALWASKPYGSDPVGIYGCGPTAMAMVVSSLTDTYIDPAEMAVWAYENGFASPKNGSFHAIVEETAAHYGLNCVSLAGMDADTIEQQLVISGGIVVALMGPGHFTQGGHFILLHGVTLTGDFLVADPNSRDRSLTAWDPAVIMDELYPAEDHGAPLWLITRGNPLSDRDGEADFTP